jgi:hypothetical protein
LALLRRESAGLNVPRIRWLHCAANSLASLRRESNGSIWPRNNRDQLKGQIWLGDEVFLKRMERLSAGKPVANVPRAQRDPARPTGQAVTAEVLSAYRIKDEQALCSRAHQEAFQGWVYLLRRAANLPLRKVARRAKVSPSRISKIPRTIETGKVSATLRQLLAKCKAKN